MEMIKSVFQKRKIMEKIHMSCIFGQIGSFSISLIPNESSINLTILSKIKILNLTIYISFTINLNYHMASFFFL